MQKKVQKKVLSRHCIQQIRHPNATQNLLRNAIIVANKKTNRNIGTQINKEDIKFIKQADILDKGETNGTNNSFVTIKGHKENFMNLRTTKSRNQPENKIDRMSKHIPDHFLFKYKRTKKHYECNHLRQQY